MYYIKEIRQATNLTQKEFAKKFGIPLSTLRKWEQNESSPPSYVRNFLINSLPESNSEYKVYFGTDGKKYFLDARNNRVSDCLGNWISFHEDISDVIETNIGIYIEDLFKTYYEAVKRFDDELRFDKMHKIKWR